jgi:hypothetical protein
LKLCAANRKRRLSALPNVGSYMHVKISGFTRSSICVYIYKQVNVKLRLLTTAACYILVLPGLMPNIAPPGSKRDPTKRYGWKKFNTYFDESTIKDVRSIVEVRKKRAAKLE